ncbi:hypothetical protein NL676_012386 [Syzygium grande]|nr:hypothetical protein NL676_012386 [Syzygium grande]
MFALRGRRGVRTSPSETPSASKAAMADKGKRPASPSFRIGARQSGRIAINFSGASRGRPYNGRHWISHKKNNPPDSIGNVPPLALLDGALTLFSRGLAMVADARTRLGVSSPSARA